MDDLYVESVHLHINAGEESIHAKRTGGYWRNIKWLSAATWIIFFIGPYFQWGERQAVLFDIPNRQFHILGLTILPQDFWMLSLVLLFLALLLAVTTALAGRVYCGFFCFQTVWTDVFTWLEEKLEGTPAKRRKLDKASLNLTKVRTKVTKHLIWLVISVLTGISLVAWFYDVFDLWRDLFTLQASTVAYGTIALFTAGTYLLAGYMREQACFWLCPYARIQGVMIDKTTVIPSYDFHRGEPRGRIKKGQSEEERTTGDCINCKQCIAVCPTGVDIRHGQQEGCITCALCIDACDEVMVKIGRPKGLIRYESYDSLEVNKKPQPLYKRPRVWVYTAIMSLALVGIAYGLTSLVPLKLNVIHERQPLFVLQSDGSIQNKYVLKVLNKMTKDIAVTISAKGPEGLVMLNKNLVTTAHHGKVTPRTVFIRVPKPLLTAETLPITFTVRGEYDNEMLEGSRESVFIGPKR
ncbi:MAG: cytochrome c oxidase accessory protein CcoG [Candidatus Thiodiazotropha sp. (ex Lucinoma aequizonata)]|nr:cytochrome c oxidase accessory protein CcoG [Candidatus Thiodiazotropha sp. (ex Lucinoma aequizonata)]MCU7898688.1 cytochrome c oxidase accessory protein CcoG [Candidatus Thiodiazotropha sp. (ex Lucinoma aequizonata)]MCU7913022.1 cytochrome c oxidase accessory protein CcoG [Candidatus Thiodiazotropha sp. (ex Lucinoma aequizonata)]